MTASNSPEKTILLLGDTLLDPLVGFLESENDKPFLRGILAPYAQVYQVLMDETHPVWKNNPNYLFVWTTPTLTIPSFRKLLEFEAYSLDELFREVEQFADLVVRRSASVEITLVASWTLPVYQRWIQALSWKHHVGVANFLARANLLLSEKFAAHSKIVLLDTAYWQGAIVRPPHDYRLYALGKIFYSYDMFSKVAAEIKAVIRGVLGLGKKVVICDLDNTLWGGVAVDDGVESIKLGAPDPIGECFRDFQLALKALKSRGVLLAICSKNEEQFALSVIENHPAMVLKKNDFVTWRINWNEKAENILNIASELNLGLDSFVFLDDSPEERYQVRTILPDVFIPDLPVSPEDYLPFVNSLTCFETTSLSREDFERTAMYQAEGNRQTLKEIAANVEDWLHSLEIRVKAAPLKRDSLPRAAQLLNKTNQFNLSVRRMEETALWEWGEQQDNRVYMFYVTDRFGDLGLVGLASLSLIAPKEARVADFVMSCRAMGKKVEDAMLYYLVKQARALRIERISAPATKTPRNGPVIDFFMSKYIDENSTTIDLDKVQALSVIQIVEEDF